RACSRSKGQREQQNEKGTPFQETVSKIPVDTLEFVQEALRNRLKTLPTKPGVYLFRDARKEILYVGKAKSLRPRVRSYFQAGRGGRASMGGLVERIADFEVIVTGTEVEALHLEQNLVKRHRPPFNVRLRDDKSFPYIAV